MAKTFLDLDGLTQYDGLLKTYIDSKETSVNNKLTTENDRATKAEAAINKKITDEKTRAEKAESDIQKDIDAINNPATGILEEANKYTDTKDTAINAVTTTAGTATTKVTNLTNKIDFTPGTGAEDPKTLNAYIDATISEASGDASEVAENLKKEAKRAADTEGALINLDEDIRKENLVAAINEVNSKISGVNTDVTNLNNLIGELPSTAESLKDYIDDEFGTVKGKIGTPTTSVVADLNVVKSSYDNVKDKVGDIPSTSSKTTVIEAIKEIFDNAESAAQTKNALNITEKTTGLDEGIKVAYDFIQNELAVGTVELPNDMVAEGGQIVVDPTGKPAGTYLKINIKNGSPIYINVLSLVNDFTVKANADQVQLAISAGRELSADLKAGTVTKAQLDADLSGEITSATTNIGDSTSGLTKKIADLEAQISGATGTVPQQIQAAIETLDSSVSYADEGVTLALTQTNGDLISLTGDLSEIAIKEIEKMFIEEVAGLYASNGDLIVSWSLLEVNPELDYTSATAPMHTIITSEYPNTVKVVLPENITRIGDYLFDGCNTLTEVQYYPGITSIGDYAFNNCSDLLVIKEYVEED